MSPPYYLPGYDTEQPTCVECVRGLVSGYRGDAARVGVFAEMGFEYASSVGRGPGGSLPAPLASPFAYSAEGHPAILEMPSHGWHDNLWTGVHPWESPAKALPPDSPHGMEAWCAPFVADLERAAAAAVPYYAPAMHPWSLRRFDRDCRQVERLLEEALGRGFLFGTYLGFRRKWGESINRPEAAAT